MATLTSHSPGLYYASRDLPHSGADAPDRIVGADATSMMIPVPGITEPDGFWNGAIGYFRHYDASVLRGHTFHVRSWNHATRTLTLALPLPTAPVAGDTLKLFKGGKYASNQEVLGVKISGKQPEVESVTGPNITGVTLKKASGRLGEGVITVRYDASTKALSLRMGDGNDGPEVVLTGDATNTAVYNVDNAGFILVDVAFASLPATTVTDSLTLSFPKGNFIPDDESYETSGALTRYHRDRYSLRRRFPRPAGRHHRT